MATITQTYERPWLRRPRRESSTVESAQLCRPYWRFDAHREAHPSPDFDEFVGQYGKAGGQIDVTIFEGDVERILSDLSSPVGEQALEQMSAFTHQHIG